MIGERDFVVGIGTKNLLKPENSIFTNSLDKARSRMVVFSITFEGS
jgi:hypothetical protein